MESGLMYLFKGNVIDICISYCVAGGKIRRYVFSFESRSKKVFSPSCPSRTRDNDRGELSFPFKNSQNKDRQ